MGIDLKEIVKELSTESVDIISENNKEIVDIMGIESFVVLCMKFGGTELYIPTVSKLMQFVRNRKIVKDYYDGLGYRELSRKYEMTEMAIRNIVNS